MASSVVAIWNAALAHIGHDKAVQSETETSPEAQLLSKLWQPNWEKLLEGYDWSFATKFRALAETSEDAPTLWTYSYGYPVDCMRLRCIVPATGRTDSDLVPYQVGVVGDDAAQIRAIFTDEEDAEACYNARVENVNLWSSNFRYALSWLLASDLAMAKIGDPRFSSSALQFAERAIAEAETLSGNEEQLDPPRDSASIRARE